MRIDCYNACECDVVELEYGDTCYYNSTICIRLNLTRGSYEYNGVPISDMAVIAELNTGNVLFLPKDTKVILADTKVVANTKEVQF